MLKIIVFATSLLFYSTSFAGNGSGGSTFTAASFHSVSPEIRYLDHNEDGFIAFEVKFPNESEATRFEAYETELLESEPSLVNAIYESYDQGGQPVEI